MVESVGADSTRKRFLVEVAFHVSMWKGGDGKLAHVLTSKTRHDDAELPMNSLGWRFGEQVSSQMAILHKKGYMHGQLNLSK